MNSWQKVSLVTWRLHVNISLHLSHTAHQLASKYLSLRSAKHRFHSDSRNYHGKQITSLSTSSLNHSVYSFSQNGISSPSLPQFRPSNKPGPWSSTCVLLTLPPESGVTQLGHHARPFTSLPRTWIRFSSLSRRRLRSCLAKRWHRAFRLLRVSPSCPWNKLSSLHTNFPQEFVPLTRMCFPIIPCYGIASFGSRRRFWVWFTVMCYSTFLKLLHFVDGRAICRAERFLGVVSLGFEVSCGFLKMPRRLTRCSTCWGWTEWFLILHILFAVTNPLKSLAGIPGTFRKLGACFREVILREQWEILYTQ
jgi:hypothetical protein